MEFPKEIELLIDIAIEEDLGKGDVTSETLVPSSIQTSADFILKQAGVVAGLPFLSKIFEKVDPKTEVKLFVEEGSYHKAGTKLAQVTGPARAILTGERIALNFLQHASGVATITNQYVRKLKGLPCVIFDTRKTLPGLRSLEKYAVKIGGGANHRFSLNDRFTIKSNHLYFVEKKGLSNIKEAAQLARKAHPELTLEIEITSVKDVKEVLETDAQAIILSRMTPADIVKSVAMIRKTDKKIYVESLGTITLDTVRAYAETGVDGISIGSLTHSVSALDIVMRLAR